MPHVNDCKLSSLRTRLSVTTGHIDDLELQYVRALIAAATKANQINDAWMQYWDEKTVKGKQYNDRAFNWLKGLTGAEGSTLNELWHWFWCVQGGLPLPAEQDVLQEVNDYLVSQGWNSQIVADEIIVTVGSLVYNMDEPYLLACDYSDLVPPLANDVTFEMNSLGYCL